MNSTGNLILSIIWILASLVWFWVKNTGMGVLWLCVGIFQLVMFLVRRRNR
ncbi:MAG: hypothetical protein NC302_12645 [Bacteroidales bacterium]|nr:hypothetical protein [Bacteroidales bacterium]MCM1417120.1 hypothetical protein [bacterium]MCM1424770.1 hypothetical protein [bacterium]